jgi:hypothetical protein
MSKKLLVENATINPADIRRGGGRYLVENAANGKLVVTLPVTKLDEKNLNERVYSTLVMEGAVTRAKSAFEGRELLSSVHEHPTETPYVTPGAASHVVIDAWTEGGLLYNKWEVLETATGKDLRALIEADVAFGVSIRGLGSTDNYGNILDDYEFLGTDCVADPSAQLRVRAQRVQENRSQPLFPTQSEGNTAMKTRDELIRFLNEQKTLLSADLGNSRVAAHQRLARVESAMADAVGKLAPADMLAVQRHWEEIKAPIVTQLESAPAAPDRALNESKGDKDAVAENALLKKLLASRTTQLRNALTQVENLAKSKPNGDAARKTNALADARARRAARKQEHVARVQAQTVVALKAENDVLRLRLGRSLVETRVAIEEAIVATAETHVAVKEAARIVAVAKKAGIIAPSNSALKESSGRKPVGATPSSKQETFPSAKTASRRAITTGEHGIRGWV